MQDTIFIDAAWLGIAFMMGFIFMRLKLPALIGFLLTGLVLNFLKLDYGNLNDMLGTFANLGVLLLLFTIGLKIKIKNIFTKQILITATVNTIATVVLVGGFLLLLSVAGLSLFSDIDLKAAMFIGFVLSFSSTVFVVKILEERGEFSSFHGKIAIGILVIQDIFAVLFMTFVSDLKPSIFALLIPFYLYGLRYFLSYILSHCGHGELLTIFGFFATLITGALAFYLVGLKPDLGALITGMLLVNHEKADELYQRMMSYKDFFLVAFFINVGLTGQITAKTLWITLLLIPFMFVKGAIFIRTLSWFKMMARTAFLSSMSLSNYSEFALIAGVVGNQAGLISNDWIIAFALLMSLSFLIASPVNNYAHEIFDKYRSRIMKLNKGKQYIDEEPHTVGDAEYLILGFGSIGNPAYHYLTEKLHEKALAIDYDHEKVNKYKAEGVNIIWGDTSNSMFWENLDLSEVKMVLLAMSDIHSNINTLKEVEKLKNRTFKVAAYAMYADEASMLRDMDVDYVYDHKLFRGEDFIQQVFSNFTYQQETPNPPSIIIT